MTPPLVTLRPASAADSLPVWRWRNDPETRRASFNQEEISLEEHWRWYEKSLARPDRRLYVVQAAEAGAGIIWLDLAAGEATVNINIAPEWRGQGVGTKALRALSREAFTRLGIDRLVARVKAGNHASRIAFARAGYAVTYDGDLLVMARTGRLRVIAAIQARVKSARLPGKVLREAAGRPLLGWIVGRLRLAKEVDDIVVSTTTALIDDAIESFARTAGVGCFRGSDADVVRRLMETARDYGADGLIRITADCPLVDPTIVDRLTRIFRVAGGEVEYVSNVYPSTFPHGLDVEVLSRDLLERLDREIGDPFYRDWFSAFVREHPERFTMVNVSSEMDLHELRWTVDYPEDLQFVDRVFGELGASAEAAGMEEVLAMLKSHPKLREINRHLEDSAIIRGIRSAAYHHLLAERARAAEAS